MSKRMWAALIAIGVWVGFVVFYNVVLYKAIVLTK